MTEQELIDSCKKDNRTAQRELYERYAEAMLGICKRYVKNADDAEDVFIKALMKVYTHIGSFKGKSTLGAWIKQIMINESLMHLRKRVNFHLSIESDAVVIPTAQEADQELREKDLMQLLNYLPNGCRTVFNMYVIEGWKHREIAEKLEISENTSKSQLTLAKKKLKQLILKLQLVEPSKSQTDETNHA